MIVCDDNEGTKFTVRRSSRVYILEEFIEDVSLTKVSWTESSDGPSVYCYSKPLFESTVTKDSVISLQMMVWET